MIESVDLYMESIMAFSKEFLDDRKKHLAAKLIKTKEALRREGLLARASEYKVKVLIPQIVEAKRRLSNGTYGCCVDCSNEIQEERLLKHPHVSRCVPCQNEQEKKS